MVRGHRSVFLRLIVLLSVVGIPALPGHAQDGVMLEASDGLQVSADVYPAASETAPSIVAAPQAGSSRGEYREIGPRLQELGFNVLALDQRAGRDFAGVANETAGRAEAAGLPTAYLDAMPDVLAGLTYARSRTEAPVLLWGSSYSAALALVIAGRQPGALDAVLAFSPGEYLPGLGVADAAATIEAPVFVTSAASEVDQWSAIFDAVGGPEKTAFRPNQGGVHGSSALIAARNSTAEDYWLAVETFLGAYLPN